MSGRLHGQRVIVLGASSGIGLAVAREALREEADAMIISSRWRADAADSLPVGRVGSAEDIAAAYVFLMTSGFATGQVHTVDGGALLV
jgi:NAD(P)-dependent dehydrogenase (short-subunit alcohol dehydrogenase family)